MIDTSRLSPEAAALSAAAVAERLRAYNMVEARQKLRAMPRVIKAEQIRPPSPGGGAWYLLKDGENSPISTMNCWIEQFPPRSRSHIHAHMNPAVFYILEGAGYDIHDGKRYPWQAGDVVVVPEGSVHAHYNPDPHRTAVALVLNPKPFYSFIHVTHFQHELEPIAEDLGPEMDGR